MIVELQEISKVIMGQSPKGESYNDEKIGLPLLNGAADYKGKVFKPKYYTSEPTRTAKKGDILLGVRATIGNFTFSDNEYCIGRGVAAIRVDENKADKGYVIKCVEKGLNEIIHTLSGSTIKGIRKEDLTEMKLNLPPLPQQQKIANILDAADALRQNDKALLAKYDELTQALFLDMFGDPVSNTKGWEKVKLGLVTNMKAGKFIAASDIFSENNNDMFSCYGGNGLRGFVKSHTHEGEFVLIGRQGALCGNVKVTNGKFHATEHAIVCSPIMKYQTLWLYYLLKMLNLNRFATGAAQPGLNVGTLVDLEIMMVPYDLQHQFAERVAVIEQQKTIAQKSLEKSESLFNSLLQKAFKGELV